MFDTWRKVWPDHWWTTTEFSRVFLQIHKPNSMIWLPRSSITLRKTILSKMWPAVAHLLVCSLSYLKSAAFLHYNAVLLSTRACLPCKTWPALSEVKYRTCTHPISASCGTDSDPCSADRLVVCRVKDRLSSDQLRPLPTLPLVVLFMARSQFKSRLAT